MANRFYDEKEITMAAPSSPCKFQRRGRPGCQALAVAVIGLSKFNRKATLVFIVK